MLVNNVQAQRVLQNRMEQHGKYLSALMEGSRRRPAAASGKQTAGATPPTDGASPTSAAPLPSSAVQPQQYSPMVLDPAGPGKLHDGQPGVLGVVPGEGLMPPVSSGPPSDPSSYQQTHFGSIGGLPPASSGGLSALASGLAVSPAEQQQQQQPVYGVTAASAPAESTAHGQAAGDGLGPGQNHVAGMDLTAGLPSLHLDRRGSSALPPLLDGNPVASPHHTMLDRRAEATHGPNLHSGAAAGAAATRVSPAA